MIKGLHFTRIPIILGEVAPVLEKKHEDGSKRRKISFQSKYFENRVGYSQILQELIYKIYDEVITVYQKLIPAIAIEYCKDGSFDFKYEVMEAIYLSYFTRNYEQNGIEIYFDKKPSKSVRDTLKTNGWRWNAFKKCWYNYYTDYHLQFADKICNSEVNTSGAGTTKLPSTGRSATTTKTLPAASSTAKANGNHAFQAKSDSFEKGDTCIVTLENGNKYFGTINSVIELTKKAVITYIVGIEERRNKTAVETFPFDSFEKFTPSICSYKLSEGRIVSFVSENGPIIKGTITDENYDLSYAVCYYDVDSTGKINEFTEHSVDIKRILEIEYGANIFPVKIGDKIEYQSSVYGTVIARITEINSDGTVDIEFDYVDDWGDKEKEHEYYVSLDEIKLMTKGRKVLDRSVYITSEQQKSIDLNEKIKERIQNRADSFSDTSEIVQNRILYRHQKAGTLLAETYNKFAFFYDTGTGKTIMALDIIAKKQKTDGARFLIIAPKSIIKTAWIDDATKYYPNLHILPLYKGFDVKKKRMLFYSWQSGGHVANWESDPIFYAHVKMLAAVYDLGDLKIDNDAVIDEALKASAQHYIINSELFIREPERYITELGIDGIVMDESAILKNYYGKTAETMREICERMKYVYLLSGKPAPNNIVEYFSQMKIVDPETFSMSYDSFVNMFCYRQGRNLSMIPANRDLFAEMISIRSLIISKKDCLDLPDTVDVVRQIEIPDDIMRDYNELYYECMTIIKGMDKSKIFYSAHSKLAVLMKLRQMASGFFMTRDSAYREEQVIVDIHNAKLHELNLIIDQIPEEQIIIWCQFQHEIEIIEEELSKRAYTVTAYGKTKDLEKNIEDFKSGRAQYIVAHPKTLKYGVTFVNCKYTVYYSFSYSVEDYDQSHDRNYRLGQTETCTYIYIQATDTIDEIMYEKVMYKLSNAEFFEKLIKDATKHGIDYDTLKEKNDEEIRGALSSGKNGSIETITKGIVNRSYEASSKIDTGYDGSDVFITYDYLDKIEEPTEDELLWLEKNFIGKADCLFLDDGPYSERLIDVTRSDYFDFIHAEESFYTFEKDMPEEDFHQFLLNQPYKDRWVYEMYRDVYRALLTMPDYVSDVLIQKYGINDGKQRSNVTIAEKFRKQYYDEYGYTWNTARVANELKDGLDRIRYSSSNMWRYAEEIKRIFLL